MLCEIKCLRNFVNFSILKNDLQYFTFERTKFKTFVQMEPNQSFHSNNVNLAIIHISHTLITMNIQHDLQTFSFFSYAVVFVCIYFFLPRGMLNNTWSWYKRMPKKWENGIVKGISRYLPFDFNMIVCKGKNTMNCSFAIVPSLFRFSLGNCA